MLFGPRVQPLPYSEEAKAAGYVPPVETGARPECAGAAIAMQREIDAAADYPSFDNYIKARPAGLTRKALRILAARKRGDTEPAFKVPPKFSPDEIRDPNQDVHTSSPLWVFGGARLNSLLETADAITGCNCPVCTKHETVHAAEPITTADGGTARVDAPLAALLASMNAAGIRTTDSCQHLAEAVKKLWPERLPSSPAPTQEPSTMPRLSAQGMHSSECRPPAQPRNGS